MNHTCQVWATVSDRVLMARRHSNHCRSASKMHQKIYFKVLCSIELHTKACQLYISELVLCSPSVLRIDNTWQEGLYASSFLHQGLPHCTCKGPLLKVFHREDLFGEAGVNQKDSLISKGLLNLAEDWVHGSAKSMISMQTASEKHDQLDRLVEVW